MALSVRALFPPTRLSHGAGTGAVRPSGLYVESWIGQRGILLCLLLVIWSSTLLVLFLTREPTPTTAAAAAGTLWPNSIIAGGWLSDRVGHTRAVANLTTAIAVDVAALAGAYVSDPLGMPAILALLAALYFLYGAFAASSYAMFMDITDTSLGATQFRAFMGATNLCEVWATFAVGRLVAAFDYGAAFLSFSVVSLASVARYAASWHRLDRVGRPFCSWFAGTTSSWKRNSVHSGLRRLRRVDHSNRTQRIGRNGQLEAECISELEASRCRQRSWMVRVEAR